MAILRDMASMTSATTGTGTLTLAAAQTGFITFANAGVPTGSSVTYLIVDGTSREVGRGVYTLSGLTLTRATVLASTNGGAKISCSGSQIVSITDAAEDHLWVDEAQVPAFTAAQKAQLFSNAGGTLYGGMLTPPVLANFTQFGSGGTFTQNSNANSVSISMATTSSVDDLRGMTVAAPATPYRVQALIKPQLIVAANAFMRNYIGFSDGTKYHVMGIDTNGGIPQLITAKYSTATASAGTDGTFVPIGVADTIWLAAADNGTTVYFRYSYDGVNWVTVFSVAKSSGYLGTSGYTNVGLAIQGYYNTTVFTVGTVLLSWNTVASAP